MSNPPAKLSEVELLRALADRDVGASEALYERVNPIVRRTLSRTISARSADFEDLVQVAFEQIIRSVTDARFAGACSLSTWAYLIARRVGIDAHRSRSRRQFIRHDEGSNEFDLAPFTEPQLLEQQLEARSELHRLQKLLDCMKPEQSLTLMLHDFCGHELTEVAQLMGVSAAAAQSRLVRGRKELFRRRALSRGRDSIPDE